MIPSHYIRILLFVALGVLLMLPCVDLFMGIDFWFDAPISKHQAWYPRLYVGTFLFSRLLLPVCHWIGFYALLSRVYPKNGFLRVLIPTLLSVAVAVASYRYGFRFAGLGLLPAFLFCFVYVLFPSVLTSVRKHAILRAVSGSGFFVLYIILCLVMEPGHPFARYDMFNRFPDHTTVFCLEDSARNLVPWNAYCRFTADEIFQIHRAARQKQGYSGKPENGEAYREMKALTLRHLKKTWSSGTAPVWVQLDFSLEGNKPVWHKKILDEYATE